MPSVTINPMRPDAQTIQGTPTVDCIMAILKRESALHKRRRGNYLTHGEDSAVRHDDDLAVMASAICDAVRQSIDDGGYEHQIIIRRNIDASPGHDLLGAHASHGFRERGGKQRTREWISPHVTRRLGMTRLGRSVLQHFHPDWRCTMSDLLSSRWTERGTIDIALPDGLSLQMQNAVTGAISGRTGLIAVSAAGVRIEGLFPETVLTAAVGCDAAEILGHPALLAAGKITGVRHSGTETTFLFDKDDMVFEDLMPLGDSGDGILTRKCA